ncbi:MAG: enoyl-CoA hydratase/isomerase family protein [Planctomycetes bacterium]|nr:enoyl-CoA hydratase/isomerase family protein [Planctomycetota bacterium]
MAAILEERSGTTLVLTLNRPERLNAVSEELYGELLDALARAEADRQLRAVVVTGAGRGFCVGADLKGHRDGEREDEARRRYVDLGQSAAKALLGSRLPVIAAINGHAIGAGLELALACDLSVVAAEAKLRFPELGLGTFVGGGVTLTLPARVGMARARELLLLCPFFLGGRAVELGLCNEVRTAAEVLPRALELAAAVGQQAPQSIARMKRLLRPEPRRLDQALADEAEALLHCMQTRDWREGIDAFAERRQPHFTGD